MITKCKFCPNKKLDNGYCGNCKYHYQAFLNNEEWWMFETESFFIDVYSSRSVIFFINAKKENQKIGEIPIQIIPETTEEEIKLYLAFS